MSDQEGKMFKRLLSAGLAGILCMSLAACGGKDSGTGNTSGSKADGKGITVAIWDNNQLSGLKQIADDWSKESGVPVKFQVMDWDSYWTTLEAGVSGGQMPDVFWMHSSYADMYTGSDILLPLDDYVDKSDKISFDDYYDGITELYEKDGKHYAIPKDHDTIAVVYNKKIFDKYGVSYPTKDWTWEDFADTAKKITDAGKDDGVYGTYMNTGSNQSGWYDVVYSFGGEIINSDRTKSGMDNENTLKAMNFIGDKILPSCPSQDSMANTSGDTMMISGKLGMYLDGSWMINSYYTSDIKDDLAWVELPYEDVNGNGTCDKEERCSIYNGLGWSIYKNSPHKDEAFSLIEAMTDKEGQEKQAQLGVTMAAYKDASEKFAEAFQGMDLSAFTDIENDGTLVMRPYSKYSSRWEDSFTDGLIPAWNDPSQMTDVCKDLANQMNQTLAEEKE
ncbi:MAG: sugar ABC transporter substrate-binding protein [Lachnospiraceae bacterium]|jgi:multiple sugar transport system substrate-binding protein|nr:sugar ABC transporter substrate-binding protein [Lachnospiraceae bacterium]MCH4063986.1 sugar ABC transporter substrate-binding protein [Lachnospiraceae bacterium]MCH4103290.1 sugar ABC transporter substrate-binding protein [Lachnospiraceae bacterium]